MANRKAKNQTIKRIVNLIREGKLHKVLELINVNNVDDFFAVGKKLYRKKRYDIAEKILTRIVKLRPDFGEAWFNKGTALGNLGKHSEAVKCYDKAIKINPKLAGAWYYKGVGLRNLGKHAEALKCFDKAIKINPKLDKVWSNKGVDLHHLGRYREAVKCFDKAIKINPKDAEAWFNKAVALDDLGKYAEAFKCYDEALKINPKLAKACFNKGVALHHLGKYAEAVKCFDKAIKINPNYDKAWYNKGVALGNLGKHDEALKCFDKSIKINPKLADAWYNKGVALHHLGKYGEAVKCFDKATKINPKEDAAWYNKGVALDDLGKYDEAVKCYDKAIKINPKRAKAWFNKGLVLANLGKYAEEVKCYDKAIKINPKDAEAWFNKGAALANLGKYAEEVKCYDKAIKINPNYDKAWYNKGVTLRNLGKYAEAVKCYDNAIKIKPNYDKAWFNKGVSLDDLGKYDEAVKCYDNAIKINPDDAEAYFNKGIAFLNARKYNEAEDELATAKELLSNRDMKNDAQKARQYQLLAIGASKLMSKMTPLDQRFMRCLASRSLREVKEKAMGICKSIQRIIKESKKVRMPLDVKDLLDSKRICFTALSAALHFRNVNLKELNRAKRVFEKWKLDEFAASTDFLKSFVKRLRKYASLQDIPKTTQQVLLRVLAGSLYVLNGDLTAEITRKIKGKAFPLKAIERRIESEVEIQSFEVADPEKEWVKVCLVQLDFALTESFPYRLKEAQKGRIKKKVFTALEIAKKERVNIIAFPELSFAKEWAKEIKDKYKDIMIVCGSSYDKYDRNVCEIIIDGKSCSYAKCHCSIMEEGNGGGLKQGNKALVLKTRYGIISVLTCIDFDYEYNRISKYVNDRYGNPLDLIINPRFDVDNDYTFQVNSSLAMALPDGSRNHTFILHINGKNVEWGKKKGGGGTAIICNEHGHRIEKYIRDGIRPQDKIDYKIYEARNEMMLIANLRIKPTTQRRTKTGNWYRYDGRNWRVLKNKSIWQYKKIP